MVFGSLDIVKTNKKHLLRGAGACFWVCDRWYFFTVCLMFFSGFSFLFPRNKAGIFFFLVSAFKEIFFLGGLADLWVKRCREHRLYKGMQPTPISQCPRVVFWKCVRLVLLGPRVVFLICLLVFAGVR